MNTRNRATVPHSAKTDALPGAGTTFPGWALQASCKDSRWQWYLCDCRRGEHHFFNTSDLNAGFAWAEKIVNEKDNGMQEATE